MSVESRWTGPGIALLLAGLLALSLFPTTAHAIRCATNMPGMPAVDGVRPPELSRAMSPGHSPDAPPLNPQVGDSWLWWLHYFAGGPPHARHQMSTIRAMGPHCYVVVEDSIWAARWTQAEADHIVEAFENSSVGPYPTEGIWSLDTGTFGPPPDVMDHDPRVYLVYYDFDAADGFWNEADEYPDSTAPWIPYYRSNECEAVYMDCVSQPPSGDYMLAVMAHEFSHMIHWARDPDEDAWVGEGVAEYAMWMFGHPDALTGFAVNPDNDLTAFGGSGADYQSTYLYMLYLHERFGGRPMLGTLMATPTNSITGVTDALASTGHPGETFSTVFREWCVANYLDDPTIGDGRWGYADETVPHLTGRRFTTYPQNPPATTVNPSAADYIVWVNGAPSLTLGFNGADSGQFSVFLVQMGGGYPSLVEQRTISPTQDGSWNMPGFASWVDSVLMVVENTRTSGTATSYTFTGAINPTGGVPAAVAATSPLALEVSPNPSAGEVRFLAHGEVSAPVMLSLYAADGRPVCSVGSTAGEGGSRQFTWDGRDHAGRHVPPGVYWARLAGDDNTVAKKVIITK